VAAADAHGVADVHGRGPAADDLTHAQQQLGDGDAAEQDARERAAWRGWGDRWCGVEDGRCQVGYRGRRSHPEGAGERRGLGVPGLAGRARLQVRVQLVGGHAFGFPVESRGQGFAADVAVHEQIVGYWGPTVPGGL